MSKDHDFLFKVVIIGSVGVGKTNVLLRLVSNTFDEDSRTTIGVDFKFYEYEHKGHQVCVQLWDTAGQEKLEAIAATYYRDAVGAVIIYDITSESSFNKVPYWLKEIRHHSFNSKIILLGNKSDLVSQREVQTSTAFEFARQEGLFFMEVSAKTNENQGVQSATHVLIGDIVDAMTKGERKSSPKDKLVELKQEGLKSHEAKKSEKSGCC